MATEMFTAASEDGYEIRFRTPNKEKFLAVQEECRRQIDGVPDRIEKVRKFIRKKNLCKTQTFRTRNVVGDLMETIYEADGITIDYCEGYGYLEIFGLTEEEYRSLCDILDIRCL